MLKIFVLIHFSLLSFLYLCIQLYFCKTFRIYDNEKI